MLGERNRPFLPKDVIEITVEIANNDVIFNAKKFTFYFGTIHGIIKTLRP